MLLFVIIETAPTFFKMMIASGPYDDLLRSEMHKARVMSDKRISDLNDEINTEILISTEKNKNRLEAEIAANKADELLNVKDELEVTKETEETKGNVLNYSYNYDENVVIVNPIDEMVADSVKAVEQGFQILKIKVGKEGSLSILSCST